MFHLKLRCQIYLLINFSLKIVFTWEDEESVEEWAATPEFWCVSLFWVFLKINAGVPRELADLGFFPLHHKQLTLWHSLAALYRKWPKIYKINYTNAKFLTWFAFVGLSIPHSGVLARDFGEIWLSRVERFATESGLGGDGDRVNATDPAALQKALGLHRIQNQSGALFRSWKIDPNGELEFNIFAQI